MLVRRIAPPLLAALALAVPASAGASVGPCAGLLATDATGDAFVGLAGAVSTPLAAGSNTDLTGLYVANDGADVRLGLRVANLDRSVPPDAMATIYRFIFTTGAELRFVDVEIDRAGAVTAEHGVLDPAPSEVGPVRAELVEGPGGSIEVVLPVEAGGTPGTPIASLWAFTSYSRGAILTQTDRLPDRNAVDYRGTYCPGILGVPISLASATLARSRRAVSIAVSAEETVTELRARLERRGRTHASGELAVLEGSGSLVLRGARRLRRGRYTLLLEAIRADGSLGRSRASLRLR